MQMSDTLDMTLSSPLNLTPSTLSMAVLATTADAVYLRLPRELQRPIEDGCQCAHCQKDYHATPAWDTLVVPTAPFNRSMSYGEWHSYTVHMPDGAVRDFVAYVARKAKEARGQ